MITVMGVTCSKEGMSKLLATAGRNRTTNAEFCIMVRSASDISPSEATAVLNTLHLQASETLQEFAQHFDLVEIRLKEFPL